MPVHALGHELIEIFEHLEILIRRFVCLDKRRVNDNHGGDCHLHQLSQSHELISLDIDLP